MVQSNEPFWAQKQAWKSVWLETLPGASLALTLRPTPVFPLVAAWLRSPPQAALQGADPPRKSSNLITTLFLL